MKTCTNRWGRLFACIMVALLGLMTVSAGAAAAFRAVEGDNVVIGKTETVKGDLYAAGGTTIVEGTVTGDLIVASRTVVVNGRVEGSILAAGDTLTFNGPVGANIRAAGRQITIGSTVGKNVTIVGESGFVSPSAVINGDLLGGFSRFESRGSVGEDLRTANEEARIGGTVGGAVKTAGNRISVLPGAAIKGRLTYYSPREASIADTAKISGGVDYQPTKEDVRMDWRRTGRALQAGWLAGILGLGLLLWAVYPLRLGDVTAPERETWTRGFLLGLAGLVGGPILIFAAFATVIGIPVAMALLGVYLVGMMLTLPLAGGLAARQIMRAYYPGRTVHPLLLALAGMAALLLLRMIPIIGPLVGLASFVLGYGLFLQLLNPAARRREETEVVVEE